MVSISKACIGVQLISFRKHPSDRINVKGVGLDEFFLRGSILSGFEPQIKSDCIFIQALEVHDNPTIQVSFEGYAICIFTEIFGELLSGLLQFLK